MLNPYQRLLFCLRQGQKPPGTLLVASGPSIYTFSASDGTYLSRWTKDAGLNSSLNPTVASYAERQASPSQEPPGKRQKLAPTKDEESGQESPEIITSHGPKKLKQSKQPRNDAPAITNLCSTRDGKHIVAITGEDKCVRVLALSESGILEQLSQRAMPKRPNALTLTHDHSTILCGDKFGDVYALPLFERSTHKEALVEADSPADNEESVLKSSWPAASPLTVHSKKNLESLRMQQKAAATKVPKQELQFEHHLLLGHVSLLTDVLSIKIALPEGVRNYILTSDRDEHIRVSRGIPQAHITEGFCLGHSQFVNKLCSPSWRPEMLISGGGDDYLLSWDWVSGDIRQRIDLRDFTDAIREPQLNSDGADQDANKRDIAVSGIWAMQTKKLEGQMIVTCESIPAIFTYSIASDGHIKHRQTLSTGHNVLDVTIDPDNLRMLYALDNVHKSGSTTELEAERTGPYLGSRIFSLEADSWVDESDATLPVALNTWAKQYQGGSLETEARQLTNLFYGIANLRKRGGAEDQEQ